MSQTRSEVLSLLKQFDQEFTVFEGAEESFILDLARGSLSSQGQREIDWQRLAKATFVLPHCYILSRQRLISGAPAWFLRQAQGCYLHQVAHNELKIAQMQKLARLFEEAGVKVVFLKGAAELAYSHDDTDFLGRRFMHDVDVLCAPVDLGRVDELLRSSGCQLWDYRLKHWSREKICQFSLNQYSHYIYDAYGKAHLEVHGQVAVGANRHSYPPDFERLLMDESQKLDVRGTNVFVPKPEHLVVYSLCHAASRNNNQELIYLDRFYLDEFSGTDCIVSPPVLVNRRLDVCQLQFLLRLRDLLIRFDGCLNFSEMKQLFSQVAERDLNEMYVMAGSYIFDERFPVSSSRSSEAIRMTRQRYVSRYMLPLLSERIESIIRSRLEDMTAEYIEQQVEKIAMNIERRVIARVIERMKSFMSRRAEKVLPTPFRKIVRRLSARLVASVDGGKVELRQSVASASVKAEINSRI